MKPISNHRAAIHSSSQGKFLTLTYGDHAPIPTQTIDFAKQAQARKVPFGANRPPAGPGAKKISSRPRSAARTFVAPTLPKIRPNSPFQGNKENTMKESNRSASRILQQTVDSYQMGRQIGHGAYAVVREAVHKTRGEKYAVKVYEKHQLWDPQKKRNVTREIDILKKLNHQNIVKLYETLDGPKNLCLVFELIRGGSLHSYIKAKEGRKLDEHEARRLFGQIVDALRYCHHKGVIHRDLKLENLLLDDNRNVKIIDFGFSTATQPDAKLHMFCGTPSYMAPEIVNKKDYYGPPADIWSLGVLLYAMLMGKFPFKGSTERELFKCIAKGVYATPVNVSVPAKMLLNKLMQVDPLKRPTCDEIMKDPFMCEQAKSGEAPSSALPKITEPLNFIKNSAKR